MPVVDDFARAAAGVAAAPPTCDLRVSARQARLATVRQWLAAAWQHVAQRP
jgi:hypothetical protein